MFTLIHIFNIYSLLKTLNKITFILIFFCQFHIVQQISQITLKVNKIGTVLLVNKYFWVAEIYVNGQFIDGDTNYIYINNIEDEITLVWYEKFESCQDMFSNLPYITEIDLSNFESSEVTSTENMFFGCTSLKSVNLKNFNTSKVTSMCKMFANCSSLTSIDVSGFQTSKVTDMEYMFYGCYSLVSLDISNFDTSSNRFADKMFMDCFKLKFLNISGFDTSGIQNFNYMFNNCSSLKSLDLSSFDTSNAQSSNYMFYGCISLTSLDISNFNMDWNYNMDYMFANCKNLNYLNFQNLKEVILSEYDFFSYDNIFYNTPENMIMCFTPSKASILNSIFANKGCEKIYCNENWKEIQNKINAETGECMASCNNLYDYDNRCYNKCPEGTKENDIDHICETIIIEITEKVIDNLNKENTDEIYEEEEIEMIKSDKELTELFEKYEIADDFNIDENFENQEIEALSEKEIEDNIEYEISKEEEENIKNEIFFEINDSENKENEGSKEIGEMLENELFHNLDKSQIKENEEEIREEIEEHKNEIEENNENEKDDDIETYLEKEKIILGTYPKLSNDNSEINTFKDIGDKFTDNIIGTSLNTHYINNCSIYSFLKNECKINYQSIQQKKEFISEMIIKIKDGSLDSLLESVINNNENIIIENKDEIYSITTLSNQNIQKNRTVVNLGECENKLKKAYNMSQNANLIIFKIEKFIPEYKIPIVEYELFSENGKINLDLNLCKGIKTNTFIPVDIDENNLYKYDPKDKYYNDRCHQHTTENGTDITLYDRQKEFNENHLSLCEKDCEYKGYDKYKKIVECECVIKNIKNIIENIDKKQLLNEFKNVKKILNIDLIKCYKLIFTINGLKSNIGNYIILSIIILSIICSIYFCIKGYHLLSIKIQSFIKIDIKPKLKNTINTKEKIQENENKTNAIKFEEINRNHKYNSRNTLIQIQDEDINNSNIMNTNNNKIIQKKKKKKKIKKNKNNKINKKNNNEKKELNDYEMNSLSYEDALKYDKRSYFSYYLSLLKTKQIIIFTFFTKSDYNSRIIKIILFLLSFALFYSINALFFTDSTMHKIYIDHGIYNFLYQLPQIAYSTIISTIIDTIISNLSLTEESISEFKQMKLKKKINESKKIIKCIYIKFIFFYILNYLFLGFIWYYLSVFCAVYKNTQIFLLKDTLISFATSLVYPFASNLIPGLLRIPSLRAKNQDRYYLYKFSQIIQIFLF